MNKNPLTDVNTTEFGRSIASARTCTITKKFEIYLQKS